MIDSLGDLSIDQILKALDAQYERSYHPPSFATSDRTCGPFGIMNLVMDSASPDSTSPGSSFGINQGNWTLERRDADAPLSTLKEHPTAGGDFEDPDLTNPVLTQLSAEPASSIDKEIIVHTGAHDDMPENRLHEADAISLNHTRLDVSPFSTASRLVPQRSPELLRYFKSNIVSLSFPLKHSRWCPWQSVHLPKAEKTYAELLLHQTASHTSLSLFYSLLAASCLHISTKTASPVEWKGFGETYKQISKHQLRCSVEQEIAGQDKVKYKELLMAFLSMAMLEVPTYVKSRYRAAR